LSFVRVFLELRKFWFDVERADICESAEILFNLSKVDAAVWRSGIS